ncbi:MAG: aminotransferase class V-fold PLP-dependent enzyme [Gammaproteobacteria bacterium]|nr:aminotransferase class V-fold PLP-dependent enzyme [Gammaproteobacteria bacterium]
MKYKAEFALDKNIIYLNHAAVSPWPLRTRNAVIHFAEENCRLGSLNYLQWIETETALRKQLQILINAPSHQDIALVKNTSEALSIVAYGIHWQMGDNVVITNLEFPSNHIVWESLSTQGVELRIADVTDCTDSSPEQTIFDCCDSHTRLISVSSVQYARGLKMDLPRIGEFCKSQNILFCVDAIQSVGALKFDIQQCQADFAMADGHKWMLGPEGLGFFYCASHLRDQLELTQYGWHMVEDHGNYEAQHWRAASSARRFECGSPNMLGIHALNASLSLILEAGLTEIEQRVLRNTRFMLDEIDARENLKLLSPSNLDRLGGIVTFKHKHHSANGIYKKLRQQNIMCAERGGGIRFSPHFYTDQEQIRAAIDLANTVTE